MWSREDFEKYGQKRLRELIGKGVKPVIIASFLDLFGDGVVITCHKCGVPVFIRPWIAQAVIEHELRVQCACCTDPRDLKGQLITDLVKMKANRLS